MNDSSKDVWYEGDHVHGGGQALINWGYPREEFWTFSAGYNLTGEPQVLGLGLAHVSIVNDSGDVVLEVGHREVRGVRSVAGVGLEVHVAPGLPRHQTKWTHVLADRDAKYMEESWLTMPTLHHNGIQLNRLHWKEEDYAYYVGRVITEAARCDVNLINFALMVLPLLGLPTKGLYGASGAKLAEAFEKLGEISLPLEDLRERYLAWYQKRNYAVHGFRPSGSDGRPDGMVYKPKKGRGGRPPEVLFDAEEQDFVDLARIWRAFYSLNHDVVQASSYVLGAANLTFPVPRPSKEETIRILETLPTFNSVSDSERLPFSG